MSAFSSGALAAAIERGDLDRVLALIGDDESFLHAALFLAAEHSQLGIAEVLLRRGASAKVNHPASFETALQAACRRDDRDLVRLLLDHGADTGWGTEHQDAFEAAAGNLAIERALVEGGYRSRSARELSTSSVSVGWVRFHQPASETARQVLRRVVGKPPASTAPLRLSVHVDRFLPLRGTLNVRVRTAERIIFFRGFDLTKPPPTLPCSFDLLAPERADSFTLELQSRQFEGRCAVVLSDVAATPKPALAVPAFPLATFAELVENPLDDVREMLAALLSALEMGPKPSEREKLAVVDWFASAWQPDPPALHHMLLNLAVRLRLPTLFEIVERSYRASPESYHRATTIDAALRRSKRAANAQ